MGDELLKKTGSGNLFMVFGEPDIEVKPMGEGRLTIEIRGLDVYDPTTGAVRSSSVDDIGAWFLDTDYDGEAFIVRHAFARLGAISQRYLMDYQHDVEVQENERMAARHQRGSCRQFVAAGHHRGSCDQLETRHRRVVPGI